MAARRKRPEQEPEPDSRVGDGGAAEPIAGAFALTAAVSFSCGGRLLAALVEGERAGAAPSRVRRSERLMSRLACRPAALHRFEHWNPQALSASRHELPRSPGCTWRLGKGWLRRRSVYFLGLFVPALALTDPRPQLPPAGLWRLLDCLGESADAGGDELGVGVGCGRQTVQ